MKRRIIWLVILPWRSGLYFLLDENSYQGWDALEAADFRMGATRRQVHDQPCIWRRFFTPMLTFVWRALPAAGFLLNITGENTSDFENFMSICWCVGKLFYLRCLLAWNYCCCTSELWIYTTVLASLLFYFCGIHSKVTNPCIHCGCKFVRLIFLLILFAAVEIVGFILLSSNAAPFVHLKCEP